MTNPDESPPLRESKSEVSEIVLNMKASGELSRLEQWIGQKFRERTQEELEQLRSRLWENLVMDSQTIHKRDILQPSMDLITPKGLGSIRPSMFSMGIGFSVFKLHDLYIPPIVISTPEDSE